MTARTLHGLLSDTESRTTATLLRAHVEQLATVIEEVGIERASEQIDISSDRVTAIVSDDPEAAGDLQLAEVATILALAEDTPDAEILHQEALDELLFGMSLGVLDVDIVAAEIETDLDPREVQGMLEGRHPLTLREYLELERVIRSRTP